MPVMRLCIAGCPSLGIPIYAFPPENEPDRRNKWFRMFNLNPALYENKTVHICRRHFSNRMTQSKTLPKNAYPDINLYMYNERAPYVEKYSVYWKNGDRPPGEDQVMAIDVSESGENISYEMPGTELSDVIEVDEVVVPQEGGMSTSAVSLQYFPPLVKHQKRQCILNCPDGRNFHNFPSLELEPERRKQWLYLLAKDPDLYPHKYLYLCDRHFDLHMRGRAKLMRGAYPNKNLPPPLQTPIPQDLEGKTECIQKCSEYHRKYRFPSFEQETERRIMWFKKFGRDPKKYNDDVYACDSHFGDEMRIGPYLRREAVPNKNLRPAAAFAKVKKWSLQKLDALSNFPTLTSPTHTPEPHIHQMTTTALPTANESQNIVNNLSHILVNTTVKLPVENDNVLNQVNQQKLSAQRSKNDNILNRINMTILPPSNQPEDAPSPVQYVKMHTVGVFVPRRTGYLVSVDKILSAEDPLDVNKHMPYDYVRPCDPELNINVHTIFKEDYGDFSSDEEEADKETPDDVEVDKSDTESAEEIEDCASDEYEQIPTKRRRDDVNYEVEEEYELWRSNAVENEAGLRDDSVLEQLATKYPTESFSILLSKDNKVVEYRKDAVDHANNEGDIITPDEPVVISDEEEPTTVASKRADNGSFISTTDGFRLSSQRISFPQHSKTDFANTFLKQRQQQKPNNNFLTKEVALAKSWQQVIETIDKELISSTVKENATEASTTVPNQTIGKANAEKNFQIEKVKSTVAAGSTNITRNIVGGGVAAAAAVQGAKQVLRRVNTTDAITKTTTIDLIDLLKPKAARNSCILKCESFRKLYAFPSAATEKYRRHFWFLELGLNIKSDWYKSLYICDKHFADNMLIEDKLHKYAYPSKSTKYQLNTMRMEASTQTEDVAEWKGYTALLRELTELAELDKQQDRVVIRTKFLIRLKQEASRLVAEIQNADEDEDVS
ncbi:PREDICTED: uncharacterized protein LOC108369321 [Rhagoletis zephyria]|uniref:uncharacterized protein LOC108369321 n=1 Tax=Rhagoletis zephyria TaxID=28612 RepID=UPI0008117A03|nr:PREDICTED: uncharacterized protein LOC108369321 [Rhagoletis zephyria]